MVRHCLLSHTTIPLISLADHNILSTTTHTWMIAHILLHGISILRRSACGRSGEDTQTSIYQAREAGEWWTKLRYATLTSQFLIVCNDVFAVVLSPALADSISQRTSPVCQKAIEGDQEYFRSRCWVLSQSCTRGFQFQRT